MPRAARDSGIMAPVPGQKRLMIIKMVLENFKSYAGVKEIGPFHKCFSSVVGPNGSGKSNVIDAMLFVFGKRAKKLRLNKVSELIHRSEDFPNLEYATVSVHFQDIIDNDDGDNGYDIVPGSQLVVTRTAYTSNQSKYMIDGKNTTFAEVSELLKGRGIDLDNNRFLILQGEVEQIAMMRPKAKEGNGQEDGLLEYLEEIIGSNRHVPAITAAAQEVDQLNESRAEQLNRVKISEKERENLEEARAEALALLGKERDLRTQRSALYQLSVIEAKRNVATIDKKHTELSAKLEYERGKLTKATGELEAFETSFKETRSEYEALSAAMLKTKEEFAAFERRDIKLQEDVKHLKAQQKKLKATAEKEKQKGSEALALAEEREASLPGLEAKAAKARTNLEKEEAKLATLMEGLKGKTEELRSQLEGKQAVLAPKREALLALQSRVATIETEMALLREASSTAQRQVAEAKARAQELERVCEGRSKEVTQAQAKLQSLTHDVAQANQRLQDAEGQEKALTEKMQAAVAAAESAKAWLQQSGSLSASLREILKASRPGGALAGAGVCGRLGDLGSIDAAHDTALSTACGGLLDFIVVETAQGGAACVEFLRANNLGRASFIILEQLGYLHQNIDNHPPLPPNTPRMFDLVTSNDAKYRPAFYMALRNTLLAKDLDTAVSIAYDGPRCKWRVVTSDGQLIDQSGAMSGGGKSGPRKGATGMARGGGGGAAAASSAGGGMAASEDDVQRLEADAKKAEEKLRMCRASKKADADAVRTMSREMQRLEASVPKMEVEIASARVGITEAQERVAALADKCKVSGAEQKKLEELEKEHKQAAKEAEKGKRENDQAEAEVKALQAAIMDVGGPKLKQQQAAVDESTSEVEKAVGLVEAAKVEATNSKRAADRAQKAEAKAVEEGEEVSARLEQAVTDKKQLEEDAFQVTKAFQEAEGAVAEKKEQLEAMTRQHQQHVKIIETVKKVEVDILDQLDEYERVRGDNQAKQKHWAAELDKLRKAHTEDLESDPDLDQDSDDEDEDDEEDAQGAAEEEGAPMEQDGEEGAKPQQDDGKKMSKKRRRLQLRVFDEPELLAMDKEDIKYRINLLEQERDTLLGNVNMSAMAEYRAKDNEYKARLKDLDKATDIRNEARRRHDELRRQRLDEFMAGFATITLKLKEMYQMITLGGDAELELVDPLDPFSEGIIFSVRPPKKSWKNISNLSGGEKTLSSLALVFALHHYKPTPLYVMDEIDAALDFKNVAIVANYIKERTKNAQFIIISLRNNMFELADRLVGIYKVQNATGSITINPKQLAAGLASRSKGESSARPLQDRSNTEQPMQSH